MVMLLLVALAAPLAARADVGTRVVPRRPLIALSAATGLIAAIEEAGGDPDRVLRSVGLERSAFASPDGFIACADFTRILEEAPRTTGDDCFGLHFGAAYNPKDLGPPTYVALNSPTLGVGFQNIGRYLRVFNEAATVSSVIEGRFVYTRHVLSDLSIEAPRPHNERGHSPTDIHESECGSVLDTLRARLRGA
jgi:hypothetical protein